MLPSCWLADDMRPAAELHSLQVAIKRLDQTLLSMADIDDMTDELQEADEKNGKHPDFAAKSVAKADREARAYRTLRPIITAAIREHGDIEEQIATFLASSPELACRLALWQSQG